MRIHTGERPYLCDIQGCYQRFSQVSNLIRHKRIHSGIKPYVCKTCTKSFSSSSNLKQHENIHKKLKRRLKYECFIGHCSKSYLYICTLKKHLIFSHKTEYDIFMDTSLKSNFFGVYKELCVDDNKFTFVNYKKFENLEFDENENEVEQSDQYIEIDQTETFEKEDHNALQNNDYNQYNEILKNMLNRLFQNSLLNNLHQINSNQSQSTPFNFNNFQQNCFNYYNLNNGNMNINLNLLNLWNIQLNSKLNILFLGIFNMNICNSNLTNENMNFSGMQK